MNVSGSQRWLAIRFPDLSLTALKLHHPTEKPVIVIEKKRIIFANALAEEAGAQVNMDITTAQLLSGCEVVERDETKEQYVLTVLSEQLYHFSPYIECYHSEKLVQSALLLEVSSCLTLFGGLKALSDIVFGCLAKKPYGFEYGLAHSAKAAWYLSFDYHDVTGNETRSMFVDRLNRLPVTLLFDYPEAMETLCKTGFKTWGDLARQIEGKSISSFRKRLGEAFTDVLCEIYGIDQHIQQASLFAKPRNIYKPEEWFEEEIQFEYPVTVVEQLKPALESLLHELSSYLRRRQQQCQYIEWCISDIYKNKEFVKVNSDSPQNQWQLLYDLSLIQFDNRELPFEVDTIKLACCHAMPLQARSQVLDFDRNRRRKTVHDFATTIAKLKARLGDSAVYKLGYRDSRVPEITNAIVALADRCHQELPDIHLKALRPTWLLTRPELIELKRNQLHWHGYLSVLVGPERVIGEWWEKPVARDYFLAKRQDSLPIWIYFDLYEKRWYVHGVFA